MANGYTLPSVQVFQDFQPTILSELPELNAFVYGPQFDFLDLDDPDERASAFVGLYDKALDTEYPFPGLPAAAVLNDADVRVVFDEAYLEYFSKVAGAGAYDYKPISGKLNEIAPDTPASAPNLRDFTNSAGTSFARDTGFKSRDVQIGDGVEISAVVGLDVVVLLSKISGFINEVIAATLGAAAADAGNTATVAASVGPVTPGGGNTGDDTVTAAGVYAGSLADDVLTDTYLVEVIVGGVDPVVPATGTADGGNTGDDGTGASTAGAFSGPLDDTYTIEVTTGGGTGVAGVTVTSVLGDDLAEVLVSTATPFPLGSFGLTAAFASFGGDTVLTAGDKWTYAVTASAGRYKVTSSSGTDDVPVVVYPGAGETFLVGTRGVTAASADGGDLAITLGDTFSIPAVKALDAVVATAAGPYTGDSDLTYTVEVVEGGAYGTAKILATSTDVDSSGPLTVASASTAVAVGSFGATIAFAANTQGGLVLGDKWTIAVTSEKKGEVKSFKLQDNVPSSILGLGTPALSTRFFIIKDDREVPEFREDIPGDKAWEVTVSSLTAEPSLDIKSGIKLTDPSYFDTGTLALIPLSVDSARQLVEWRAFRLENAGTKHEVQPDLLEIEAAAGKISVKNPLAYALSKAAVNTVNRPIKFMATADESVASFQIVLDTVKECDDVYSFAPLTKEVLHHQALDAHVSAMSTPLEGRWRVGLINRDLVLEKDIYAIRIDAEGDAVPYLAKVLDDPDTTPTDDYRLLVADDGQDVDFIRDAVVPGDVVRVEYKLDLEGETVFTELAVEEVVSSTTLKLASSLAAAVTVSSKFELARKLDKSAQAAEHALIAASLADRRLFLVYPDKLGSGADKDVEGFHLAAAVAGMRAALPPHQGFTNFQVQGFDDVSRTFEYFNRDQLNVMADAGVFIVTQTAVGTTPFVRHQLSTDRSAIEFQEMSITSNVDSISYFLTESLEPFIGVYNINPQTLADVERSVEGALEVLRQNPLERIGSQIIDGTVISVAQSEVFCDTIEVVVDVVVPCPLNNLTVRLRIST